LAQAPDAKDIVSRSVAVNDADWKALPQFSHIEKDVQQKAEGRTTKSYEVTMIEGSPYQKLIAINDRPLPADERQKEEEKMKKEIEKRQNESSTDRANRIAKYQKERNTDHLLMHEMINAFEFKLAGEDTINGHPVYVLDATDLGDLFVYTATAYAVGADARAQTGHPPAPAADDPECVQNLTLPLAEEFCPGANTTIPGLAGYHPNRDAPPSSA